MKAILVVMLLMVCIKVDAQEMPLCTQTISKPAAKQSPGTGLVAPLAPHTLIGIQRQSLCEQHFPGDVLCLRLKNLSQELTSPKVNWSQTRVAQPMPLTASLQGSRPLSRELLERSIDFHQLENQFDSRIAGTAQAALVSRRLNPAGFPNLFSKDWYQQIAPGTETPRTSPGLPGQGPMIQGSENGKPCAKSATASDWQPGSDGRIPILVNSGDFTEVGEIVRRKGSNEITICGFIVIDRNWAVTALHCVAERTAEGRAKLFEDTEPTGLQDRVRYLLFEEKKSVDTLLPCFAKPARNECPGAVVEVAGITLIDSEWKGEVPKVDLALLRIRIPATVNVRPAKLLFGSDGDMGKHANGKMTTAGYGTSNVVDYTKGYGLLVGWHDGGKLNSAQSYAWSRGASGTGTIPCYGDSGSAIFSGEYFGRKNEIRTLFAIMSYVVSKPAGNNSDGVRECTSGTIGTVVLNSYREKICSNIPTLTECKIATGALKN